MLDQLRNNDLVITNNKDAILDYLDKKNQLLNIKIMTQQEFINHYFGYTDTSALYYLVDKYHYKYDVAKMYLDNFLFDEKLFKELEENHLIFRTPLFKMRISRIVIIDIEIEPFLKKEIEKYDYLYLKRDKQKFVPQVTFFSTLEDEVEYVANRVRELLKMMPTSKIAIVLESGEYFNTLKRVFKLYGIPINTYEPKGIYGTYSVHKFLHTLKDTKDFSMALNCIRKDAIYDAILKVCNQYQFTGIDDTILYLVEEELKQKNIPYQEKKEAVRVINMNKMVDEEDYYFILSFNEGIFPKIYKDEDYLNDFQKQKIGLFTSFEKNKNEKEKVIRKIMSFKNVVITYKLSFQGQKYYPSSLLAELGLEGIEGSNHEYSFSDSYNQLKLASMLDQFIKYNKVHEDLGLLMYNYQEIPYLTYDNQFQNIEIPTFRSYIHERLTLSYSSLDTFYHCSFRFFLANILNLDKHEETFMKVIGTMFHSILSVAFQEDFDFESAFSKFVSTNKFSPKEDFFVSKLKIKLWEAIEIIKEQNQNSELVHGLYEKKVIIHKKKDIDVNFVGIIDKIKYNEFNGKKVVSVIDYKTGVPYIELNHLYYGLSMQLPIYLYLLHSLFLEDVEIAGFYLQKVVHENLSFQKGHDYVKEMKKLYRLEGFSTDNEEILKLNDSHYVDSKMIKGMRVSSKGFYPYTKVLSAEQMKKLVKLVDTKVEEAIVDIQNARFRINPKMIDNEIIGCAFCKFKDICYCSTKDFVLLKKMNYEEFLGRREINES